MPAYTFRCQNCHEIKTTFISYENFDNQTVQLCPVCTTIMQRIYKIIPIHFRGSGFYTTDKVLYEPTEEQIYADRLERM